MILGGVAPVGAAPVAAGAAPVAAGAALSERHAQFGYHTRNSYNISVEDFGLVEDLGVYWPPNPPRNPNLPRSWGG
jgi:hypothetical protein